MSGKDIRSVLIDIHFGQIVRLEWRQNGLHLPCREWCFSWCAQRFLSLFPFNTRARLIAHLAYQTPEQRFDQSLGRLFISTFMPINLIVYLQWFFRRNFAVRAHFPGVYAENSCYFRWIEFFQTNDIGDFLCIRKDEMFYIKIHAKLLEDNQVGYCNVINGHWWRKAYMHISGTIKIVR